MSKWFIATLLGASVCFSTSARAQWYGAVDYLVPFRASTSNVTFQRNQTTNRVGTEVLLEEDDLDLDFASAGKLTFGNRSGVFGFECTFLGTSNWTESASAFDVRGVLASPFSAVGGTLNANFDNNTSAIVDYESQLSTADLNLTQLVYSGPNGYATLVYGARYMSLDETLTYTSTNAIATHNIFSDVNNNMFGPQIGTILETPLGLGGQMAFTFKAALVNNTVDKTTNLDGVFGVGSDSNAALVSEIGVNCIFNLNDFLSIRLGYQLLSATEIALATHNFEHNLSLLGSGRANVQSDSGVAYHAPYIGIMGTY